MEFKKKNLMQKVILFYFIFINLLTFIIYGLDKWFATRGTTRVSEKELHTLSLIGGFLGATLSMTLFKHKTNKSSFLIKHSVIILLWILGITYYFTQINRLNFLS